MKNFQLALILLIVLGAAAGGTGTLGQTSSAPPQNDDSLAKKSSISKTKTKQAATKKDPDQDKDPSVTKPKRGQLVIAPIPAISPAVGSGLILAVGYVFKLNEEDNLSPPSVIGLVGAFTNNGSRGGGIGGRLYFGKQISNDVRGG